MCFFVVFFLITFLAAAFHPCTAAAEAFFLYSWLHGASLTRPPFFSDWNTLDPNPCNWTSVTCSPQGFVTGISIRSVPLHLPLPRNLSTLGSLRKLVVSDSNLTGAIPPNIGDCAGLTAIDLSSNALVGDIPRSLGKLRNLQTLLLNTNQLSGRIPPELSNCSGLRNIFLFENRLEGTIPPELGSLSKLESLRAGVNSDLHGEIPPELGECSNLGFLGLADTSVSGSIPASLGRLSKLHSLSIYTTMVSGEIPPELGNCSGLVNLSLFENRLSGGIPRELRNLRNLEKLLLWQNNLIGAIPAGLGDCGRLKSIDLSMNFLSGTIPPSIGTLPELEEFMISDNNISGSIPGDLGNCKNLVQLELDSNQLSGSIPPELGRLPSLAVFFAWKNILEGSIPPSLANCTRLNVLDLSQNSLSGAIPPGLLQLRNLTNLLLISNQISGAIPPEIGNAAALVRLRLGHNRIVGEIPREIGEVRSLIFLDLSNNRLSGAVPDEIGRCAQLQMIDLSSNALRGPLPDSLSSLSNLQVLDFSENRFRGRIPASFGRLASLNKLFLRKNFLFGSIPPSLGQCSSLQLIDLSSNHLSGAVPVEICQIAALEIALNLSFNRFTGPVAPQISALKKLSVLDLSHNQLQGSLLPLAGLDNLVSLNISYNNFTGYLPYSKLFRQLPAQDFAGNRGLCPWGQRSCLLKDENDPSRRLKLAIALLIFLTVAMVIAGALGLIRAQRSVDDDEGSEAEGDNWAWRFTLFQKLNFSVEQILRRLVDANVVGEGCSGVVYRAEMENGEVIAVKKLRPSSIGNAKRGGPPDSFSTEIKTLGSVRHRNIVRFVGCCQNRSTRLLMYDYMPNGSLGRLLHEREGAPPLEWEQRYRIMAGSAQGLAYLHHDCVPPVVHRDIKANNILIGPEFEPCIGDFGIAKLVGEDDFTRCTNDIAGSCGYIAPEYGYMLKITEKSDVYSYGVVALEILTGKKPNDPTIPDGLHVVDWVSGKRGGAEVLEPSLRCRPRTELEEMNQAMGIALLCVNSLPDERPTMKDVAAMLKEIRHDREEHAKLGTLIKGSLSIDVGEKNSQCLYSKSNDSSLSASSLLRSSSSTAQMGSE